MSHDWNKEVDRPEQRNDSEDGKLKMESICKDVYNNSKHLLRLLMCQALF